MEHIEIAKKAYGIWESYGKPDGEILIKNTMLLFFITQRHKIRNKEMRELKNKKLKDVFWELAKLQLERDREEFQVEYRCDFPTISEK